MEEAAGRGDGVRAEVEGRLWRAGDSMASDEKLDYDSSAYDMLHRLHMEWPCLTFAFAKDGLGEQRSKYPLTSFAVAGTQAEQTSQNKLVCAKFSQLSKTRHDEDSSSDDDDDDDDADADPVVEAQVVPHEGTVNRLRLMPQAAHICATWADTGKVHVFDLAGPLSNLASPGSAAARAVEAAQRPIFTFTGHEDEGFALDFSPARAGAIATGDCTNKLHVWHPREGGASWAVDPEAYRGHTASVEDIAWSPVEPNVLMSCGCDR
jgi:ribosome assembly protein RRB1